MTIITLLFCLAALLLALLIAARPSRHLPTAAVTERAHRTGRPSTMAGFISLAEPAEDELPQQLRVVAAGMQ